MGILSKIGSAFSRIGRNTPDVEQKSFDVITLVREGFTPKGIRPGSRGQASGLDANVVMSPIMWVMRIFGESRVVLERRRSDGRVWEAVQDSPFEQLIDRPNDYYDGDALLKATVLSYMMDGNAYWYKVRNVFGDVIGLWYLPHWSVRPAFSLDGRTFIPYYQYAPGVYTPQTVAQEIPVRDMVHLRFGLDPENPRYGLSPLRAVLREAMTDEEAALFSQAILHNMGVPGVVVSPKTDAFRPNAAQRKELATEIDESYGGGKRGRTLVLDRPTDVAQFGFDANKIMLPSLRDISEERVCAAIGVPAAVVGFGAGMQSTKVGATMQQLVRLAWVQCINPTQKSFARQLTRQLVPDFQAQTNRFRARFDDSDVSAFQEDDSAFEDGVRKNVQAGILRVDRAQQLLGLEVDPTQQVYIRPANAAVVDEHGDPAGGANPAPQANASVDPAAAQGDAEDAADELDDRTENDDAQKMLRAIAHRLPKHLLSNGNGKH